MRSSLPEDTGFHDAEAVANYYRDKWAASAARSRQSIAQVLRFLDQRIQPDPGAGPVTHEGSDLSASYRKGMIAQRAIQRIGCDELREHELLEGVDAILQFIELVLRNSGHGGDSGAGDIAVSTPANAAPHRFDGGAK